MHPYDSAYPHRLDVEGETGLTARDLAAIELLPAVVAQLEAVRGSGPGHMTHAQWCASETYCYVDALIAESLKASQ